MGRCDRASSCAFFTNHSLQISDRLYDFLVATYCEGDLQPRCKRRKWHEEKEENPPELMLPNGYFSVFSKTAG